LSINGSSLQELVVSFAHWLLDALEDMQALKLECRAVILLSSTVLALGLSWLFKIMALSKCISQP
jgi:hypothetical protein